MRIIIQAMPHRMPPSGHATQNSINARRPPWVSAKPTEATSTVPSAINVATCMIKAQTKSYSLRASDFARSCGESVKSPGPSARRFQPATLKRA